MVAAERFNLTSRRHCQPWGRICMQRRPSLTSKEGIRAAYLSVENPSRYPCMIGDVTSCSPDMHSAASPEAREKSGRLGASRPASQPFTACHHLPKLGVLIHTSRTILNAEGSIISYSLPVFAVKMLLYFWPMLPTFVSIDNGAAGLAFFIPGWLSNWLSQPLVSSYLKSRTFIQEKSTPICTQITMSHTAWSRWPLSGWVCV